MSNFVVGLVEALPTEAGGPEFGVKVEVTEIQLTLPIEARFLAGPSIALSSPRGRLTTGFVVEFGRISMRFERSDPWS